MQTIVEVPDAKAAGMSDDERAEFVSFIAVNPEAGDVTVGTGGARKVRFGAKEAAELKKILANLSKAYRERSKQS